MWKVLYKISQKAQQQPHEAGAIFQLGKLRLGGGKQPTQGHLTSKVARRGFEPWGGGLQGFCHCARLHL